MTTNMFSTGNSNDVRLNNQNLKGNEITEPKQSFDDVFLKAKKLAFKKNVDVLEYLKDK